MRQLSRCLKQCPLCFALATELLFYRESHRIALHSIAQRAANRQDRLPPPHGYSQRSPWCCFMPGTLHARAPDSVRRFGNSSRHIRHRPTAQQSTEHPTEHKIRGQPLTASPALLFCTWQVRSGHFPSRLAQHFPYEVPVLARTFPVPPGTSLAAPLPTRQVPLASTNSRLSHTGVWIRHDDTSARTTYIQFRETS